MKFVYESLEDILKPKSKEEIDNLIKKYSSEEIIDLWKSTGNKYYLKYTLENFPDLLDLNEDDILEIIEEFPEMEEDLLPDIEYIISSKYTLEKKGEKYYICITLEDLYEFFNEDSRDFVKNVLSGQSLDMFYPTYYYEMDELQEIIDTVEYIEEKKGINYFKNIVSLLKEKFIKEYPQYKNVENIQSFKELINFFISIKNKIRKEYFNILEKAFSEATALILEEAAYNDIIKIIKDELDLDFSKEKYDEKSDCFNNLITKDILIRIFKIIVYYKISYRPPYYGYNVSVIDRPDIFLDSLLFFIEEDF